MRTEHQRVDSQRPDRHSRSRASPYRAHLRAQLNPQSARIDLGGTHAATFAYGGAVPGPVIRANVGDQLEVTVKNRLNHSTSVHWHGIALPLVALAEGKDAVARALLSTGAGQAPDAAHRPPELNRLVGTIDFFTAAPEVDLGSAQPDVTLSAELSGGMMNYDWTINGHPFSDTLPLTVQERQRANLTFNNMSMMWHPMHLHGHTFQVTRPDGRPGPRKDTVIVLPMRKLTVGLVADSPGEWMLHCHNTYHQEAGMMTSLNYTP